jgi:hypothetical protein
MTYLTFAEFIKKKKHISYALFPIVQDYTKDTTIGVFCLNPASFREKPSENIVKAFKNQGYTRLYLLYLFSRIGDFSELSNMPLNELTQEKYDERMESVIADIEKVFFAYGDPPNDESVRVIDERVSAIKKLILKVKPETTILRFGSLTKRGYPKSLNNLQNEDIDYEFEL